MLFFYFLCCFYYFVGSEIPSELIPVPEPVKEIPGRQGNTTLEILFMAQDIPPLGILSFHIDRTEGGNIPTATQVNLTLTSNTTNTTSPVETSQEIPELEDIVVDNGVSTGRQVIICTSFKYLSMFS